MNILLLGPTKQKILKNFRVEGTFSTIGHTATMVPVFTKGPSSEIFSGIYDNTSIFKKMLKVVNE